MKTKSPPATDLLFRAFADRTRLRILHMLANGELCVCDIVGVLEVPQPKTSRHLAYLRRAGLVTGARRACGATIDCRRRAARYTKSCWIAWPIASTKCPS